MSWLSTGQTTKVEHEGAALEVRIFTAREMIAFLREAEEINPTADESTDAYHALIQHGLKGWAGEGVPAFDKAGIEGLSMPAMQKVIEIIIQANTLTGEQKGNSHAS